MDSATPTWLPLLLGFGKKRLTPTYINALHCYVSTSIGMINSGMPFRCRRR